jgi:hypothetical protein
MFAPSCQAGCLNPASAAASAYLKYTICYYPYYYCLNAKLSVKERKKLITYYRIGICLYYVGKVSCGTKVNVFLIFSLYDS